MAEAFKGVTDASNRAIPPANRRQSGSDSVVTAAAWFRAIADALHGLFHGDGHVTFDGEGPDFTRMVEKASTLAY
jgi:hypothetical protein